MGQRDAGDIIYRPYERSAMMCLNAGNPSPSVGERH